MAGLNTDDPRPAYVQVADALRDGIRAGKFKPGEQLPSSRHLAMEYRIAPMTARQAIDVLRSERLVVTRQGAGAFVRSDLDPNALEVPEDGQDVADQLQALRAELSEAVRHLDDRLTRLEQAVRPSGPSAPTS